MNPARSESGQAPLRVGLIGFGLAGSVFHAPLIAATPALRLTTIVTADEARRRQAAAEYPDARLVRTADELLADPSALDLVVIASPNRTHVPLAIQSLRAGLHVVVDKPFAATAAEGLRVIEEAERAGRHVTVFQNRRWDGDFLTLRRLIDAGTLGDIMRIESRFERWRPVPRPGWKESGDVEDATGVLYDLGSHLIDQVLVLFGPAASVYAELRRRRPTSEVVDDAFVAITHASGVQSHLHTNMISAQPGPRYRVLGTRATFTKFGLDVQEAALRSGARPGDDGWGEESPGDWGSVSDSEKIERVRSERGAYETFYARVAAALRGDGALPVDARDAVATAAVIDAAMSSADEGRIVSIESTPALASTRSLA
jgi:predicted dehydrogenase